MFNALNRYDLETWQRLYDVRLLLSLIAYNFSCLPVKLFICKAVYL